MSRLPMNHCEMQEKFGLYFFDYADPGLVASQVQEFFADEGYNLEEGTPRVGVYGTGSAVARALIGVFAKRYKYSVNISTEGATVLLRVEPAMTGASGGLIGYEKTKTETRRILMGLQQYFPRGVAGVPAAPAMVAPAAAVPVAANPEPSQVIAFQCAGCGATLRVPVSSAGKKGKCPKCRAPCDVPQAPGSGAN
jgi:hypothetical protein